MSDCVGARELDRLKQIIEKQEEEIEKYKLILRRHGIGNTIILYRTLVALHLAAKGIISWRGGGGFGKYSFLSIS